MSDNKKKLLEIAEDIRNVVDKKQKELELSFVEDTHTYYIKNKEGKIVSNLPSVSTVITQFYVPFDDLDKSLDMCDGHVGLQDTLLTKWRATATYAIDIGSRVHFLLETDLLKMYKSDKTVRKPIFDCDDEQVGVGNKMIDAGHKFLNTMHRRGAVLLDTEMVLGSIELGYTGQPDKVWLMYNDKGELGFVITDWKTNKPKNFMVQPYTEQMLPPFEAFPDTSLSHYKIQLPMYGKLILDMLKGSKYENIKFFGCVIVHLLREGQMVEYRVENYFIKTILDMEPLPRIGEVLEYKKNHALREEKRLKEVKEFING
jgi:hypothetical protein